MHSVELSHQIVHERFMLTVLIMEEARSVSNNQSKNGKMEKMVENINAPLYWRAPASCQILDLKERHYNDVLRLIKRHFFSTDPVCRALSLLEDSVSTQSYLESIRLWMKDTTSLVAISPISSRVVGAAIARINSHLDRSNTYSRIQIMNGDALEKILVLKNILIKQADAYRKLKSEMLFRIYILCVHPSYESKGLRTALLEACIQMAISLEIPAIGAIFTSGIDQQLAGGLGFDSLAEIQYSNWRIDNKIVCGNPGTGNYFAAFMGTQTSSVDQLKKKLTISRILDQ